MRPASGSRPRSLSSGCCGADAGTQAAVSSTFKLSSEFLWSRSCHSLHCPFIEWLLQQGWVLLLFFLHLLVAVLQEGSGAQGSESEAWAACLECTIESFPYTLVTNEGLKAARSPPSMRREASHDCGRGFLLQAEPPPQHLSSKLLRICCCWALSQPHEVRHLELFKPPRSQLCETNNRTELWPCSKLTTRQSQTKSTQDDGKAPCQLALQTTVAECIPDPLYLTRGDLRHMQPHMLFGGYPTNETRGVGQTASADLIAAQYTTHLPCMMCGTPTSKVAKEAKAPLEKSLKTGWSLGFGLWVWAAKRMPDASSSPNGVNHCCNAG